MLLTFWSAKGGVGASTVCAGVAGLLARPGSGDRGEVLLVDLAGDQPALLGTAPRSAPGVRDWLAAPGGDAAALRRLEVPAASGVALLPSGTAPSWPSGRSAALAAVLAAESRPVVVDLGVVAASGDTGSSPIEELLGELAPLGPSLLVVRPCYLALRRAVALRSGTGRAVPADGIVLVDEPGRALDAVDVARAVGLPVVATVAAEPVVARAVDAGLLGTRLPRSFARALDPLLDGART